MHKKLIVHFHGRRVGVLLFSPHHYEFEYDQSYLLNGDAEPISLSFPLSNCTYISEHLFPFFEGLLTEGWLQSIQEQIQHLDRNDSFAFLAKNGLDLIGAVSLSEEEK